MEIVKITTKVYKVIDVMNRPFMLFSTFREVREKYNQSVQKTCFNCHKKFLDDDYTYIAMTTGGVKLLCNECHKIALKDLKKGE